MKTKRPDPGASRPGQLGTGGRIGATGGSLLTQHILKQQVGLTKHPFATRQSLTANGSSCLLTQHTRKPQVKTLHLCAPEENASSHLQQLVRAPAPLDGALLVLHVFKQQVRCMCCPSRASEPRYQASCVQQLAMLWPFNAFISTTLARASLHDESRLHARIAADTVCVAAARRA